MSIYFGKSTAGKNISHAYFGRNNAREITKAYIGVNGKAHQFYSPIIGKQIRSLPIGTKVYLRENGVYQPYEIIHHGVPRHQDELFSQYGYGKTYEVRCSTYDNTVDGTWLLRYYRSGTYELPRGSVSPNYENNVFDNHCMNVFFPTITDKHLVKMVNIPVANGASSIKMLSRQAFLLSSFECGTLFFGIDRGIMPSTDYTHEGAPLDFVNPYWDHIYGESPNITQLKGHTPGDEKWLNSWALRSFEIRSRAYHQLVYGINGDPNGTDGLINGAYNREIGIRPALIVHSTSIVDENNQILP